MATGKTRALIRWTFVGQVMSLLFNMLSRLVITSSEEQASFNFMAEVTICSDFGAQKDCFSLFPLFLHLFAMKWWDQMPWSLFSECWALSQLFHSSLSLSSRGSSVLLLTTQLYFWHFRETQTSKQKTLKEAVILQRELGRWWYTLWNCVHSSY